MLSDCVLFTTGVPAVSLPTMLSSEGLPIGLQLIANHFQEETLLSVAKWLERQVSFPFLNLDFLDKVNQ